MTFLTDYWEVITGVLTVIGTAIAWMWSQRRATRLTIDDRLEKHTDRLSTELEVARADVRRLTEENVKLRVEKTLVEAKVGGFPPIDVISVFVRNFPGLMWVKRRVGADIYEMIMCSEDYARFYLGGPPELYISRRDREVHDEEDAKTFNHHDEQAYKLQSVIKVREEVSAAPSGVSGVFVGAKWHVQLPDGTDCTFGYGEHEDADD